MAFVPPTFTNLGKATSDLFKKKFDEKKDLGKIVVKTVNKTASGLVLTSGGDFDSKNNLTGNIKAVWKKDTFGDVTGELSTAGPAKIEVKMKKLAKGLTLTVVGDTAPAFAKAGGKFSTPTVKLTADYSQDFFTGTAQVESALNSSTNLLVGSAVIGFEGLSVGGEVKFDTAAITDVEDYNVGAEYAGADYLATLKTAKQGEDLTAQYNHKVNADLILGAQFVTKLDGSDKRSAALVEEYKVDANTTFKARADTNKVAAFAIEHRLPKVPLQVGLSASYELTAFKATAPKDFGLALVFNDYAEDK